MSAAAVALLLAILSGAASVATIAGSGSQAIINIRQIEGGAPMAAMPRRMVQMTPLGPANPSFDGK